LRQIILNLTGNAIKFTAQGEVFVEVACVEESPDEVLLRFEISDTGIGIPPEAQERLFKPFSQADSSTTRKYGGTGLGLVICKQLVENMGGEIGVRSSEGEGSTFWFTVRLEKQPATCETAGQDDLAHLRVLIVDDHPTQRKVLSHHLHAWRVRNGLICAPQEAVAFLRSAAGDGSPYDFVVLDLQHPGRDGAPLARAIKSAPELSSVRLVMLTSLHLRPLPPELQAGGIDAVLTKPVRPSTLYACFVQVLRAGNSTTVHFHRKNPDAASTSLRVPASDRALRILVAEDNAVNQKVAVRQLEKLGYCGVDVAANGLEVVEALKRAQYDVVLMDCQMPELDGYDATRRIRQFSSVDKAASSAAVHIIAMTANAMDGDRELCLASGMDDYIAKPMRIEELRTALEKIPLDRVADSSAPLVNQTA
jgi:CheY-like chemotaxis protein